MRQENNNDYAFDLQSFYAQRDEENKYELAYGYVNPVAAAYWHLRDELVTERFRRYYNPIGEKLRILEVGTGHAHELSKFSTFGIPPQNLFGIDLVGERLQWARTIYPLVNLSKQDASLLSFPDNSFDLVFQFTCVMHAPDKNIQKLMCQEMIRVLKPGGIIIWWDVAPLRWRVINLKRIYQVFFEKNSASQKFQLITQSIQQYFKELFSSTARQETIRKETANYILPVSKKELAGLFPGCPVFASDVGLDYAIWNNVWKVSPLLAKIFWYSGLLSSNCFGIIEKKKDYPQS